MLARRAATATVTATATAAGPTAPRRKAARLALRWPRQLWRSRKPKPRKGKRHREKPRRLRRPRRRRRRRLRQPPQQAALVLALRALPGSKRRKLRPADPLQQSLPRICLTRMPWRARRTRLPGRPASPSDHRLGCFLAAPQLQLHRRQGLKGPRLLQRRQPRLKQDLLLGCRPVLHHGRARPLRFLAAPHQLPQCRRPLVRRPSAQRLSAPRLLAQRRCPPLARRPAARLHPQHRRQAVQRPLPQRGPRCLRGVPRPRPHPGAGPRRGCRWVPCQQGRRRRVHLLRQCRSCQHHLRLHLLP
mmetsp:Transcript_17726/g.47167  ORF Transcript_17726/g.47167 Transcript_17726/m.47167 type:complete len:302 (-) Transcript_17726:417-1322(-)